MSKSSLEAFGEVVDDDEKAFISSSAASASAYGPDDIVLPGKRNRPQHANIDDTQDLLPVNGAPKIRSKISDKDDSVEDAKLADAKKKANNKLKEIDRDWKKRAEKKGEPPQGLADMYKIITMGCPIPFLDCADLIIKQRYYKSKLESLNNPQAPFRERLEAAQDVERWNKGAQALWGTTSAFKQQLQKKGMLGSAASYLMDGLGGLGYMTGLNDVIGFSADILYGGYDLLRPNPHAVPNALEAAANRQARHQLARQNLAPNRIPEDAGHVRNPSLID